MHCYVCSCVRVKVSWTDLHVALSMLCSSVYTVYTSTIHAIALFAL